MQLHGLHHVTAITAQVGANVQFYTRLLGLRLVKRTVNQDDTSAYHLFYADKLGSPGTDMTFFDWSSIPQGRPGTDSIDRTIFRVNGAAALDYWQKRFEAQGIVHTPVYEFAGRRGLDFLDAEGQRLALVDDAGVAFEGAVWDGSDVPADCAIRGFHSVVLAVPNLEQMSALLTRVLEFTELERHPHPHNADETVAIFGMDGGGPGKEVIVVERKRGGYAMQGYGSVHHVAFRVRDAAEQDAWLERLHGIGVPTSGQIDRFYFRSLYFRISNGILFELATDGPGFATDEPQETMGERLALPPFLESQRARIEANLKPITLAAE